MGRPRVVALSVVIAMIAHTLMGCVPAGGADVGDFIPEPPSGQTPPDVAVVGHLHVTSYLRTPPNYDLRWVVTTDAATIEHFVVYRSTVPITTENRGAAAQTQVAAEQRSLLIDLRPNTGLQFFRVAAVDAIDASETLSAEYVVDTTSRVAFRADRTLDERVELFTSTLDGLPPARVSGPVLPGRQIAPDFAWSPDGRFVAWLEDATVEGVMELLVAPADGSLPSVRVSGAALRRSGVKQFAWSPDARSLAFISDREIETIFDLYVAPAGGGIPPLQVSLTAPRRGGDYNGVADFAWAPDGTRLAFTTDDRVDDLFELYVVPADGGRPVLRNGALSARAGESRGVANFAWSPDGSRLAYIADQNRPGVRELYTVSPEFGSDVKVNGPLVADGAVRAFAWSPGSDQLAFLADRNTQGVLELYVVGADGGFAREVSGPLTAGGSVLPRFSWSRDAASLAFLADKDIAGLIALYTVSPDGGLVTRVSGTLLQDSTVFEDFAWSPDSLRLAARLDRGIKGNTELYTLDAAGGLSLRVNRSLPSSRSVSRFTWSPDGLRLAYVADQDIEGRFDLFVAPADGSGTTISLNATLLPDSDVFEAAWSPLSN